MNDYGERRDGDGVLAGLLRGAQRVAEAAAGAVRERADRLMEDARREIDRVIAVYALTHALVLFVWTTALGGAAAIVLATWSDHRIVGVLMATAGFALLTLLGYLLLARLQRPVRR